MIFENTHEPIISQQDFDLVQEIRNNRRRQQKTNEINPFSGIVYFADCGKLMYISFPVIRNIKNCPLNSQRSFAAIFLCRASIQTPFCR
ncbi:hypothetical protein [Ruminococcus albus]|uniref:hypothetical protein n=1 Tax=Ruminococcus albus TaxID=1264 RepID=UPI003D700A42